MPHQGLKDACRVVHDCHLFLAVKAFLLGAAEKMK
jgi:hypothetical protein